MDIRASILSTWLSVARSWVTGQNEPRMDIFMELFRNRSRVTQLREYFRPLLVCGQIDDVRSSFIHFGLFHITKSRNWPIAGHHLF